MASVSLGMSEHQSAGGRYIVYKAHDGNEYPCSNLLFTEGNTWQPQIALSEIPNKYKWYTKAETSKGRDMPAPVRCSGASWCYLNRFKIAPTALLLRKDWETWKLHGEKTLEVYQQAGPAAALFYFLECKANYLALTATCNLRSQLVSGWENVITSSNVCNGPCQHGKTVESLVGGEKAWSDLFYKITNWTTVQNESIWNAWTQTTYSSFKSRSKEHLAAKSASQNAKIARQNTSPYPKRHIPPHIDDRTTRRQRVRTVSTKHGHCDNVINDDMDVSATEDDDDEEDGDYVGDSSNSQTVYTNRAVNIIPEHGHSTIQSSPATNLTSQNVGGADGGSPTQGPFSPFYLVAPGPTPAPTPNALLSILSDIVSSQPGPSSSIGQLRCGVDGVPTATNGHVLAASPRLLQTIAPIINDTLQVSADGHVTRRPALTKPDIIDVDEYESLHMTTQEPLLQEMDGNGSTVNFRAPVLATSSSLAPLPNASQYHAHFAGWSSARIVDFFVDFCRKNCGYAPVPL